MCGICGIISHKGFAKEQPNIDLMLSLLQHRGPDGSGSFYQETANFKVGLGHTRLSIIDLDPIANQPMTYANLTIVYNGEVYNFAEIREILINHGYNFNTSSDSEVILKAIHLWGLEAYTRFNGMFAIAIFDRQAKTMTLVRDRLGVKPLFYSLDQNGLTFASELRAIRADKQYNLKVSQDGLLQYYRYGYTKGETTIYDGILQLKPGTALILDLETNSFEHKKLWSLISVFDQEKRALPIDQILNELEPILVDACKLRMVSDVPVGMFLSGGYDSSLVAAIIQKHTNENLRTFSIGFTDNKFNEANYAKDIADFLGTNHSELYCSDSDALRMVERFTDIWDEPFADSSAIPTALLSEFTSNSVKVALSADGGDEIFGGYKKYHSLTKKINVFQKLQQIPGLEIILEKLVKQTSNFNLNGYPKANKIRRISNECGMAVNELFDRNQHIFEAHDIANYFHVDDVSLGLQTPVRAEKMELLDRMLFWDLEGYLPDNILRKVDRSTMAFSLEGREPLLDYRIIEYMGSIRPEVKIVGNELKYLLKRVSHNYIPKRLLDRPKKGFNAPVLRWMRGCLKDMIIEILSEERILASPILKTDAVLGMRDKVISGAYDDYRKLWTIFIYENWLQNNCK